MPNSLSAGRDAKGISWWTSSSPSTLTFVSHELLASSCKIRAWWDLSSQVFSWSLFPLFATLWGHPDTYWNWLLCGHYFHLISRVWSQVVKEIDLRTLWMTEDLGMKCGSSTPMPPVLVSLSTVLLPFWNPHGSSETSQNYIQLVPLPVFAFDNCLSTRMLQMLQRQVEGMLECQQTGSAKIP